MSLHFSRVVWVRQINLELASVCMKFKELDIEEVVREKGQSERTQPRLEHSTTMRRGELESEKQQTVPRRETRKTLQGD